MDDIVDDDGAGEVVNEDEETQDEAEVNADEESDDQADPDDDDEAGEDNPNDDGAYEIDLGAGAEDDEEEIQEASGDDDRQSDQTQEEECENEEPEHEMPVLEAEIARVLDDGCSVVQLKLEEHLLTQKHRLAHCEQQVQSAIKQRLERVAMYEQLLAQGKRERNDLQTQVEILNTELRREQEQRADEREWLAELWPDNVPLPTLLLPIKKAIDARRGVVAAEPVKFVKDLSDDQGRRRLEALMTRRVEGERVRRQLEEVANWKLVLPENPEDGDGQVPYYTNTHTGVSVWDAPVAMLFEAPPGWNMATMDWEESYGLENFYPGAQGRVPRLSNMLDDENDVEGTDSEGEDAADSGAKVNVDEEEDEDEEDDAPMDPMPARERFEEEMKRYEQLKNEVQQSAAKQRSLAMEVLTANRELFEQEQEVLKEEDAAVIAVERKRRIAEKEEQAAAKAKAEAEQRKAQQASTGKASVVPVFARDSVARKGLTLAADDQVFEQELQIHAFVSAID
ncbi:Armadillo-type fold [Phytophthora cinnamomi]|uniref:Armadillo-type fold n=1 Tax=Phytophthora cinnamomi TaxID=4785 RepID=UPI0035596879|nr:Armadillo-type fold [Phytophthora cinnamomi]